jgi:glycosyltransferase 2 family protein
MQLIVINSLASVVGGGGGVAPVQGGMGVVEAGLIGGLTAAGIPQSEAVAATFTHRLFTAYLPPIWGWFALQWLRRQDYV